MKGQINILLLAVIVGGLLIVSGTIPLGTVFGGTTLSLDEITFDSGQKQWNALISVGGSAESLTGSFSAKKTASPSEVKRKSGTEPENPFSISLNTKQQTCEYNIIKDDLPQINKYTIIDYNPFGGLFGFGGFCTTDGANNACGKDNWLVWAGYKDANLCYCITRTPITSALSVNGIANPNVRSVINVLIESEGKNVQGTIDTKQNILKKQISPDVSVEWIGNTIRQSCDSAGTVKDQIYGFKSLQSGSWETGLKSQYQQYILKSERVETLSGSFEKHVVKNIVGDANRLAGKATTPKQFGKIENAQKLDGAVLQIGIDRLAQVPLLRLLISADFVKVKKATPNIFIDSVTTSSFKTNGFITVNLRNEGSNGNVNVFASCNPPFGDTNTAQTGVPAKGKETVILDITANVDRPVKSTCTVTINDGIHTRKTQVIVSATPEQGCVPNSFSCLGTKIMQCNNFGSRQVEAFDCSTQNKVCSFDNSKATCSDIIITKKTPGIKIVNPFSFGFNGLIGFITSFIINAIIVFIILSIAAFALLRNAFVSILTPIILVSLGLGVILTLLL